MSMRAFRAALQTQLQTSLSIHFESGRIEGPSESKDLGCTFPIRIGELASNIIVEQQLVGVRILKQLKRKRVLPEKGIDPGELEDLAEAFQAVIAAHQVGLGPWMIRCSQIDFDLPSWGIEALIVATDLNAGL